MKKFFISISVLFIALAMIFTLSPKSFAKSGIGKVDCLICNPGEDCSTELRFAWKSCDQVCKFYFTSEYDTEFANASVVRVSGTPTKVINNISSNDVVDQTTYAYEYSVSGLVPGTKYLYKVASQRGDYETGTHNATTASLNGSFNFIWLGDNHLTCADFGMNRRTLPTWSMMKSCVDKTTKAGKGGIDLVISTGDTVSYGSYYDDHLQWDESYAWTNFIFADSPGNHDYYERSTGSSKMTTYPEAWEVGRNMPDNGYESYSKLGIKSNYYFFYNSCMFVSIDSIASGRSYTEQKQWLIDVVTAHQGEFQWLIVYEHYPFFDGETAAISHYSNSDYKYWWDTFDLLGVDLALSGDSHVYLRSKPLKNNKIDETGTVYMTCPNIGDRYRFITDNQNDDWMAVRIGTGSEGNTANYGLQDQSGLGYIVVTPESLTFNLIDTSLTVKDTFTMTARRELPETLIAKQEQQGQILADSFEMIGHKGDDHEVLVFDNNRLSYIKSLQVMNGNQVITYLQKVTSSVIDLDNLDDDKVYELDVILELTSGKTLSFKVRGSTYASYGTVSNFKVSVQDGKTVLNWDSQASSIISKYKVFEGKTPLGVSTTSSLALNEKKAMNTVYTLKAYTANDEVIYETKASYKLIGDINYDGSVSVLDCDSIYNAVFASTALSDLEKEFGDLNADGKVDFADVAMIMLYTSGKINKTYIENYTVTFKGEDGKDISSRTVEYGDSAVAPEPPVKSGYTFIGWSKPITNVTEDLIVYAIYQKN